MRGLALMVNGRRLAGDALDARDIPSDLTWESSWQGGFTTLSCGLLRTLRDAIGEEAPDSHVRLVADGGARTVWEGRLTGMSRTITRARQQVTAEAQGNCSLLEDREDAMWLGIDRDSGKWQPNAAARKLALIGVILSPEDASAANGGLWFDASQAWATNPGRPAIGIRYDASPLTVGRLAFGPAACVNASSDWIGQVNGLDAAGNGSTSAIGDWMTVATSGTPATATQPAQDVAIGQPGVEILLYNPGMMGSEVGRTVAVPTPAIIGNHGLTLTGTSAADYGVKYSDAAVDWLARFAPRIKPRNVVDSVIGIQHLAFTDPTTVGEMLRQANNFHGFAYGVWEANAFDLHPYGAGASRTWYVRANDPGVNLELDGLKVPELYTQIVVNYTTTTGERQSVGPTGTVAMFTDDTLQLTDPTHPLVRSGRQRVKSWDLGVQADQNLAAYVGRVMLAQINAARRSGRLTLWGKVYDQYGAPADWTYVRGGDYAVVLDSGDTTPRRIVTAQGNAKGAVVCTVDNTRQTVEAMLAHLGARGTGRI